VSRRKKHNNEKRKETYTVKRTIQTILVLTCCTLTSGASAAEVGNDEAVTKEDVANITKPHRYPARKPEGY
jgi:hypothetical protein